MQQEELLWDPNLPDLPEPNLINGWLGNQLGSKAGCCPRMLCTKEGLCAVSSTAGFTGAGVRVEMIGTLSPSPGKPFPALKTGSGGLEFLAVKAGSLRQRLQQGATDPR